MMGTELLQQDPQLTEAVRRLVAAYEPLRIYLFGSVARGDTGPDSDYDLMLIVPDDAPSHRLRSRLAYEALRGTGIAADVLVWTRSRFERRARVIASLAATVLREGKMLHDLEGAPRSPARRSPTVTESSPRPAVVGPVRGWV